MAIYGGDEDKNELSRSEIEGKLKELENGLDVLRRRYEQFFVGKRERPPKNKRRQVSRLVRELQQADMSNTSHQFKFRGLMQRFTTYKNKWNRVEREIEEGTYEPHQERARKRLEDDEDDEESEGTDAEEADESEASDDESVVESEDGAYELDIEQENVDLGDFQQELEEMDREGEFEDYVETERVDVEPESDASSSSSHDDTSESPEREGGDSERTRSRASGRDRDRDHDFDEERETRRKQNLRKLQDKLGLSKGSGDQDETEQRRDKLNKVREQLEQERSESDVSSSDPSPSRSSRDLDRERPDTHPSSSAANRSEDFNRDELEETERLEPLDDGAISPESDRSRSGDRDPNEVDEQARGGREHPSRNPDRDERPRESRSHAETSSSAPRRETSSNESRRSSSRQGSSDRGRSESDSERSSSDDEEDDETRRLYEQLINAKERCSRETDHLTFESVKRSIQTERTRLSHRRRIECENISFRVVTKEGDAYLQAELDGSP